MGKIKILLMGMMLGFLGCATMLRGTHQLVRIETDPPGALVTIDNNQKLITPASVKLKRNQSHLLYFEKTGYQSKYENIRSEFNAITLIYAGLIDFVTGACYDLKPDHLYVHLEKINREPIGSKSEKSYEETEEITKPISISKPPKLIFDYSLIDENQDKILDGGEKISLKVIVRNQGEGNAKGVKVLLSGESKVLNYLGREKFIGDIPSGTEKIAVFEAVLPYKIEPDNANLIIRVTEAQGFDALKECELLIAMQPAKVEREREIISTLVDVDQPLKPTSFRRENAYAIVIGISDYRSPKIPKVKYAKRDAETVKDYLTNICGIPSENIVCLTNEKATGTDLIAYIEEWLQRNVNKNSFVFIYFAGHGTPNPEKGDAYLVPYDGEPGFISKLYPLSRFYNSLENLPTENIVVALDACFSGAGGRSVIEEGKRPLINVKIEKVGKKAAVLTASASDEISQDLDSKRHGLFTYYILKGLRGEADLNNDGWITLGELYNYCQPKVKEESRRLGYTQTPKVFPEPLGEKANIRIGKVR
ncbi:MAG: caspase family protein [candidate division WOR-3 bacterium]